MVPERTSIYCQNCCAQNSLKESHCERCGTRLLLVVFPSSLQFDSNQVPSYYEDHLLERISLLELRFIQLTEGLKAAGEVIRDQSGLIRDMFHEIQTIRDDLGIEDPPEDEFETVQTGALFAEIVAAHDAPNVELFSKLIDESLRLFEEGDEKEGFRMLGRAILLSPRNGRLFYFAGLQMFAADLFDEARERLERCVELEPDNLIALMLAGALAADSGDFDKARRCLSLLAAESELTGIVNLIWCLIAAADNGKWSESLAALKIAAETIEEPEVNYLMGCLYFELKDDTAALRCFQKTISIDRKYADAWFMQSLIYHRQGDLVRYANMLDNAFQTKGAGSQCDEYFRAVEGLPTVSLPFRPEKAGRAMVLTGGPIRINRFMKSQLLKVIGIK